MLIFLMYQNLAVNYSFYTNNHQQNIYMNKKDYDEFMKHCQVLQKLSDDRTLLQVQQTQELIVMRKMENISSDLIPVLSQQKQLNHEHVQSVIDYCQVSPDCVFVFTEYSTHTLEEELVARRKSNTRFSLEELENILVSVLKALGYLESQSIGHGCVSRKDVVISNDGVVKLIDPSLASSSPLDLISGYYYSPELLSINSKAAHNRKNSISNSQLENIDFFKSDVFVLGLFIVELGLLHSNLEQCVVYDKGYIDYEVMDKYLNQFQCMYPNEPFINLLCGMLQEDPNKRLNVKGALDFIQDQFDNEEFEEEQYDMEGSNASSYLYSSKGKTVKSFLLSQGPISSVGQSLRQSQQSLLYENSRRNSLISGHRTNNKTGKTPLIRC